MRLSQSRRPKHGQKGWTGTRNEPAGAEVPRERRPGPRAAGCSGKMLSGLTLKHLPCPGPYARRFRACQFLFNKLPARTTTSFLGNMSLPHVLENLRVPDPGATRSNSWWAPVFSAAPKEGATKPPPRRGCHGPRGPSPGQVWSLFLKSSYPISTGPTLPPATRLARRSVAICPPIPLLPRKDGERLGPYVNTSGKLMPTLARQFSKRF